MVRQYKKLAFSLIALLAITTSMFKTNIGDAILSPVSHKPFHSTKTAFSNIPTSSSIVIMLEMDEEAVDGEESDDDIKPVAFEFLPFTQITFAALERVVSSQPRNWQTDVVKSYHAPIYLLNRNFRL